MEGGSRFVEYLTYGMIAVVLGALLFLFYRTARFFLSLLVIPLGDAASRWRPTARLAERWGARGARRDPTSWRHTPVQGASSDTLRSRATPPRAVVRGMTFGAALGALPGVWLAVRGAQRASASGGTVAEVVAAAAIALGLVAAAGGIAGGTVGTLAGLAWSSLRPNTSDRSPDA